MAYAPYTGSELPNLTNVTKRLDPNGQIATVGELLTQFNPILDDIPLVESNLATGHRVTVRADIPTPTWRMLNYGVRPTKSNTAQVEDTIGMLEDYAEVDKDIAMLNGNTAEFRMSEDITHMEGMSNNMASTLFYGDTVTYPERFHGLAPRYASVGTPTGKPTAQINSNYLKHVISAGGDTADVQSSIWYIVWGASSVFGIYPKGSMAGLQRNDHGEVTLTDNDGGRFQGFRTHYQWKMGLCVKDWRYVVRICNVELADLEVAASQILLYQAMIKAMYTTPQGSARGIFYASPAVSAMLDIAATNKTNAALGITEVFGQPITTFRGVPVRSCNAILETEAVLS
jgi:hypothetical protein